MAKCPDCKKEMSSPKTMGCTHKYVTIRGKSYIRDAHHYDHNVRCHDCNIKNEEGNVHHFGCDIERCPICGGQLISCDCGIKKPTKTRKASEIEFNQLRRMHGLPEQFGF